MTRVTFIVVFQLTWQSSPLRVVTGLFWRTLTFRKGKVPGTMTGKVFTSRLTVTPSSRGDCVTRRLLFMRMRRSLLKAVTAVFIRVSMINGWVILFRSYRRQTAFILSSRLSSKPFGGPPAGSFAVWFVTHQNVVLDHSYCIRPLRKTFLVSLTLLDPPWRRTVLSSNINL